MFIITNKDPEKAVRFLVENTNKAFYFKQLIELGQLVCSAGFSNIYKEVKRGKEIQEWIRNNKSYTLEYMKWLWGRCMCTTKMSWSTRAKIYNIMVGLERAIDTPENEISTCIFRYKKEYKTDIPTNTELPIDEGAEAYKKYIKEFKFNKNVKK